MEKWTVEDTLIMAGDTCVARVFKTYHPEELQEANAELIVSCVNFCESISTEWLNSHSLEELLNEGKNHDNR